MATRLRVRDDEDVTVRCYRDDSIFKVPDSLKKISVICLSGGGGGGGGVGISGGGGGSATKCKFEELSVRSDETLMINVGKGGKRGKGGKDSASNGGNGKSSVISRSDNTVIIKTPETEGGRAASGSGSTLNIKDDIVVIGKLVMDINYESTSGGPGGGFKGGRGGVGLGAGGGGAGHVVILDIPGVFSEGTGGNGGDNGRPGADAILPGTGGGGGSGGHCGGRGADGMVVIVY